MNLRLLITLLFLSNFSFSQKVTLSPQSSISLITVSPGNELYSSFGHSSILVEDYQIGLSVLYNYGSFDFNTANFYIKFLRGTLPYQLTKNSLNTALEYWTAENRLVTKQILKLNQKQKQTIFDLLEANYLPQNRTYQYKFFYDNCSTRPRDILINALGNRLLLDSTLNPTESYRFWVDTYAGHKSISDFGMDIAIGTPSDEATGYMNAMYIPDNLMQALDSAKIKTDTLTYPFVSEKMVLNAFYVNKAKKRKEVNIPIILAILLIITSIVLYLKKLFITKYDYFLFSILGISGLILTFLWIFTDHGVTVKNFNLLWASPFLIPFLFFIKKAEGYYFLIFGFLSSLVLLIDITQIQDIPLAADFISISLMIRYLTLYRQAKTLTNGK